MAEGFLLHDRHVFPTSCDGLPTIQIHVHDVPVWVSDAAVTSALSPYGKLIGPLRHGRKQLPSGANIATGVRFATFELQPGKAVPRDLPCPDNAYTFRIYREGEPPTCTHCKSFNHHSDDCRKKAGNSGPKPNTRRWETSHSTSDSAIPAKSTSDSAIPAKSGSSASGTSFSLPEPQAPQAQHDVVAETPREAQKPGEPLPEEQGETNGSSSEDDSAGSGDSDLDESDSSFESSFESLESHYNGDDTSVTIDPQDTGEVTPVTPLTRSRKESLRGKQQPPQSTSTERKAEQTSPLKSSEPLTSSHDFQAPSDELPWETPGKRKAAHAEPSPDSGTRETVQTKKRKKRGKKHNTHTHPST